MKNLDKFISAALHVCEDYTTTTPDSENIELIWFTPVQLQWYTEYCLGFRQLRKRKNKNPNNE